MSNEAYTTKYYAIEKVTQNKPLCLSMLLGHNTFMFAVFTDNYKQCIELGHVQINEASNSKKDLNDAISFLINNNLLHQRNFEKVNLSFLSSDFTMVPEAFAANPNAKTLLKFSSGASETSVTRHHNLNGLSFFYAIDQQLIAYFENTFRNISIRQTGAVTINLFLSQFSLMNSNVFLNIYDSVMEIAVKENNNLIFYNTFRFENNEDILYYLLFTMEQFELDPLLVKLSIAGQLENSSELIKSIKRYIKQTTFCARDSSIKLENELATLPHHYYFTLLNQHLCEL